MSYEIKHGKVTLTEREFEKYEKGALIFGESDGNSEVVATFGTIEDAKNALKNYRCTYEKSSTGNVYYIEEYGFVEIDDCGCASVYLADENSQD